MIENSDGFIWQLGSLPLYWGSLAEPTNGGDIPDFLNFELRTHPKTGGLVQGFNPEVQKNLGLIYSKGSMYSGLMDSTGIGAQYADDFLEFIFSVLGKKAINNCRILEIGCGTGYLLSRLKALGADVQGIEPGNHGQKGSTRFDVPILQGFFPSPKINGKFDLILMYGVLEHLEDPEHLLSQVKTHLTDEGRLLLSVPDCEPYIASGDVSMFIHEHWSYFTTDVLKELLSQMGGADMMFKTSNFGGTIYASLQVKEFESNHDKLKIEEQINIANQLKEKAEINNRRFEEYVTNHKLKNNSIGIYVPARIINTLSMINLNTNGIRFFDDNPLLHGTYLPGFPNVIESRESLLEYPTDVLMIMTSSFGKKIKNELDPLLKTKIIITARDDIFN